MPNDLLHGFIAVVALACWLATARKLVDLRRNPTSVVLRHMCLAQASLSTAITVQSLVGTFDRTVGVLDSGRMTSNVMTMVAAASGLAVGLYSAYPEEVARPQARRCMWTMAGCSVAVMVLYALFPPHYALTDPYVTSHAYYVATPSLVEVPYTVVYLAFMVRALVGVCVVANSHRSSIRLCPPVVALGVQTLLGGAFLGIAYAVTKAAAATLAIWDVSFLAIDVAIPTLFTAAILAVLAGLAVPALGPRFGLERVSDHLAARRSCRDLLPLWRLVYGASPQIALLPHPTSPVLRRVRLTVEILDGCAALAPWMVPTPLPAPATAPALGDRPAGGDADPEEQAAIAEATKLAAAARRKLDGMGPSNDSTDHSAGSPRGPVDRSDSAADQVDWLEKVSRALAAPRGGATAPGEPDLVLAPLGVPVAGC